MTTAPCGLAVVLPWGPRRHCTGGDRCSHCRSSLGSDSSGCLWAAWPLRLEEALRIVSHCDKTGDARGLAASSHLSMKQVAVVPDSKRTLRKCLLMLGPRCFLVTSFPPPYNPTKAEGASITVCQGRWDSERGGRAPSPVSWDRRIQDAQSGPRDSNLSFSTGSEERQGGRCPQCRYVICIKLKS